MKWSDYGESSLTLLAVYCGLNKEMPEIPRDAHDFRRCTHLIKCLGLNKKETQKLVDEAAKTYLNWRLLAPNWQKLAKHQNNPNLLNKKLRALEARRRL